jgi:hypothetical protein
VLSRWSAAAAGVIASLGLAGPAAAQQRPFVSQPPVTTGDPIVGSVLTSSGGQAGGPRGTTYGRGWLRCANPTDERSCQLIGSASNTSTYTLTERDLGRYMRSALYAFTDWRNVTWKMSAATAVVTSPAPPPPPPAPEPTPPPAPVEAVAQPLPTEQAAAAPAAPQTAAKRMRPFPVVRLSGVLTTNGAQITRLAIKAPRGARITIRCSASTSCPKRSVKRAARGKWIDVPSLQKYLRAGTRLSITVSRKGYISKVTTLRIRKGKSPLRSDRCRVPGAASTSSCPK